MAIEIVEFPIKHGDLMGSNGISDWIYPLVNVYKKLWTDPPFLMGKLTISMAIFNSKLLVYQRVREKVHQPGNPKKIMVKSLEILVILPANPLPDSGVWLTCYDHCSPCQPGKPHIGQSLPESMKSTQAADDIPIPNDELLLLRLPWQRHRTRIVPKKRPKAVDRKC